MILYPANLEFDLNVTEGSLIHTLDKCLRTLNLTRLYNKQSLYQPNKHVEPGFCFERNTTYQPKYKVMLIPPQLSKKLNTKKIILWLKEMLVCQVNTKTSKLAVELCGALSQPDRPLLVDWIPFGLFRSLIFNHRYQTYTWSWKEPFRKRLCLAGLPS